ncbi:MAG: hypothetical protein NZ693_02255, partial [Thermoflexales bacterium]|nr:hypothetical protein [Thermoflexales bacterium]
MVESPKLRRFLREVLPVFGTMILLAVINLLSGGFPWAVIPIVGMLIVVINTAVKIFLAVEASTQATEEQAAASTGTLASLVAQARSYKQQVDALPRTAEPTQRDRVRELANQVNEWIKQVEAMARQVDNFKRNAVIQRDLHDVPAKIDELKSRLAQETDPTIRASLEHT